MKVALRKETVERYLAMKNKSMNWLAKELGITGCYLSQLMSGHRNPSAPLREKIENKVKTIMPNCSFDDLFRLIGADE